MCFFGAPRTGRIARSRKIALQDPHPRQCHASWLSKIANSIRDDSEMLRNMFALNFMVAWWQRRPTELQSVSARVPPCDACAHAVQSSADSDVPCRPQFQTPQTNKQSTATGQHGAIALDSLSESLHVFARCVGVSVVTCEPWSKLLIRSVIRNDIGSF